MCDIPFGAFICIYTGTIRREDEAEQAGRTIGDEYFANLNYVESAENTKIEVKRNNHDSGHEDDIDFNGESESEDDPSTSPTYSSRHVNVTHRNTSPKIARRLRKRKKKSPKKEEKEGKTQKLEQIWRDLRPIFRLWPLKWRYHLAKFNICFIQATRNFLVYHMQKCVFGYL